jgi:hypothetical protein
LFIGGLFFVACFESCEEVRYRWSGRETEARVCQLVDETSYGRTTGCRVRYDFLNDNMGKQVTGFSIVSVEEGERYFVGQVIPIQYFGKELFSSRIKGQTNSVWIALLVISTVLMVSVTVVLTIKAKRENAGKAARYSGRRQR